mgnify:CR=1 FL=1
MSDKKIRTMVMAAVLAALACVATMVVQIPSPMNGYVNLGDCFVLLSGWLLGPWWGGAAGGIGSMLADLLLGYGHYAPGTLIIKGLMALVGALIFKAFGKSTVGTLVSGVVSEVVMVAGYFGYAALLLGNTLHFVYDWTGQARWAAYLAATNESTWEHMKLLAVPWVLWTIAECIGLRSLRPAGPRAAGLLAGLRPSPCCFTATWASSAFTWRWWMC